MSQKNFRFDTYKCAKTKSYEGVGSRSYWLLGPDPAWVLRTQQGGGIRILIRRGIRILFERSGYSNSAVSGCRASHEPMNVQYSTGTGACIHIRFGALKNTDSFENWFEVTRYLPRASLLQRTVLELPSRMVVSKNWLAARDAWNCPIRDW
jgi:hypothetical protein